MSKHLRPKTDAERRTVIREAKAVYAFMSIGHGDDAIVKLRKVDAMEIIALMKGRKMNFLLDEDGDVTINTQSGGEFDVEIPNGKYHKF